MKQRISIMRTSRLALIFIMASCVSAPVTADDIEIYKPAEGKVNILVDLDMSGSMCFHVDGTIPRIGRSECHTLVDPPLGSNTRGGILLSALDSIIDQASDDIQMGLTRFGWDGSGSSRSPTYDAYGHGVLLPVKRLGANSRDLYDQFVSDYGSVDRSDYLTDVNRSWKETLKALLAKDFKARGGTPIVDSLYETYRYFNGDSPYRGTTDSPLNVWNGAQRGVPSHPMSVEWTIKNKGKGKGKGKKHHDDDDDEDGGGDSYTAGNYLSPKTGDVCEKNVVILLSDGQPTVQWGDSKGKINSLVGHCDNEGDGTCGKELAAYMHSNTGVDVFTVGFALDNDPAAKAYLERLAGYGGGEFFSASNEQQLIDSFNSILDISSRSSSFATPSVSASNSPFTNDAYVYLQQFFPSLSPKWPGNVKKYRVSDLNLVDKNDVNVYDANGILSTGTFDYWNDTSEPDGGDIGKGGTASQLDTTRINHVYVDSSSGNSLVKLDNTHVTAEDFHVDSSEFDDILSFTQGVVRDGSGTVTDARRFIGDPLHARLVPVLYDNGGGNTKTVMFFGTNEGYLHAVELGNGNISGNEGGNELFAFMPRPLLKNQKYFKANSELKQDTDEVDRNGEFITKDVEHIYGMDGETQIWHFDDDSDGLIDSSEEVYLAIGMRRGGRDYYIINISDPNNPSLYMHIQGGQGDFAKLGQTWAPIKLAYIEGADGKEKRVMILAGGYDDKQDNDPVPFDRKDPPSTYDGPRDSAGDNFGNDIFVVGFDGSEKGKVLWHAQDASPSAMKYGFAGGISMVDTNGDYMADRLYAADVGGQVWRVELKPSLSSSTVNRLIDINDGTAAGNRRFYYEPSVAYKKIKGVRYFNIAIGSGFRAHPLNETIEDRFYVIRDDHSGSSEMNDRDESDLFNATSYVADPDNPLNASQQAKLNKNGWFVELRDKEKSLANPLIYNSNVFFTSYTPPVDAASAPTECQGSALGTGYFYALSVLDASAPFELVDGNPSNLENRRVLLSSQGIPGDPIIMNGDNGPLVFAGGDSIKDRNGESPLKSDSYRQEFWIDLP